MGTQTMPLSRGLPLPSATPLHSGEPAAMAVDAAALSTGYRSPLVARRDADPHQARLPSLDVVLAPK